VLVATAGRGKRDTGNPLVLSTYCSPEISGGARSGAQPLVTPRRNHSLSGAIPVLPLSLHPLGRLLAMAFSLHGGAAMSQRPPATHCPPEPPPVLNPHAAGIDIGATEIYVAVPLATGIPAHPALWHVTQGSVSRWRTWLQQLRPF